MITLSYCSRSTDNFLSLPSEFAQNPEFQIEVAKLNPELISFLPFNLQVLKSVVDFHPKVVLHFQRPETKHTMSKHETIEVFKSNPETFNYFNQKTRQMIPREILLQGLEVNGCFFQYLSKQQKEDKEFCLAAISNFPEALKYCGEKIKKDHEVMKEIIHYHPLLLSTIDFDEEMALEAVKSNGMVLLQLPNKFKESHKFILEAVKSNGEVLKHIRFSFLDAYPEIVKEAIKNCPSAISRIPEDMKTKEICLLALKQSSYVFSCIPLNYKKDDSLLKEAIKFNGKILREAPHFKNNKEIVSQAIKNNGEAILYADKKLIEDNPDLVFEALKTYHSAVQCAGDQFQNDKKLMTEAVSMNGISLKFASESLKSDKKFVISAIKNNGAAFHFAHYTLKEDEDVLLEFSKNPDVLGFLNAAKYLSKDKKLILEVVKKTRQILKFCDIKYLIDQEIRWAEKKYFISIRKVPCGDISFVFA
jgi:tetratricopeptide (TPR) repeat protein